MLPKTVGWAWAHTYTAVSTSTQSLTWRGKAYLRQGENCIGAKRPPVPYVEILYFAMATDINYPNYEHQPISGVVPIPSIKHHHHIRVVWAIRYGGIAKSRSRARGSVSLLPVTAKCQRCTTNVYSSTVVIATYNENPRLRVFYSQRNPVFPSQWRH